MSKHSVLAKIESRLSGHDFTGEVLDDDWCDAIAPTALQYLSSKEILSLEKLGDDAIAQAIAVVLREFVLWLCRRHDISVLESSSTRHLNRLETKCEPK